MTKCIICKKEVDWDLVVEEFDYVFERVDFYGVPSLTESLQVVYEGKICSHLCLGELE